MIESQQFSVCSEVDVINARRLTRQLAKDSGLQIVDQARISLAVSSMAHLLSMGEQHPGVIRIRSISVDQRVGVEVAWMTSLGSEYQSIMQALHETALEMMVDQMTIEALPEGAVTITAIKWAGPSYEAIMR